MPVTFRLRVAFVHFIAVVLCGFLVPVFAGTAELFRNRLPTKDGRKFEYVFESRKPLHAPLPESRPPESLRIG